MLMSIEFVVFRSKKFNFLVNLWFKIIQNIIFVSGTTNFTLDMSLNRSLNRKFFRSSDKVLAVQNTFLMVLKLVGLSYSEGVIRLYLISPRFKSIISRNKSSYAFNLCPYARLICARWL